VERLGGERGGPLGCINHFHASYSRSFRRSALACSARSPPRLLLFPLVLFRSLPPTLFLPRSRHFRGCALPLALSFYFRRFARAGRRPPLFSICLRFCQIAPCPRRPAPLTLDPTARHSKPHTHTHGERERERERKGGRETQMDAAARSSFYFCYVDRETGDAISFFFSPFFFSFPRRHAHPTILPLLRCGFSRSTCPRHSRVFAQCIIANVTIASRTLLNVPRILLCCTDVS
jgi:hypothetical protein